MAVKELAIGIKNDKSQSLEKIDFSNKKPSTDPKGLGRDKISHVGGKQIEDAIAKHTNIIEMKLSEFLLKYIIHSWSKYSTSSDRYN